MNVRSAFLCDAVRTPIGRYGGSLSAIRADDLAAIPLRALLERNRSVDWEALDDVVLGCANQAGEDNRNVARMAALLAGFPIAAGGVTLNRLCGSGLDAVGAAARAIASGEADLLIAGGVESMSRAPFVIAKSANAFARDLSLYDTTIGWRFVNPEMESMYGVDTMPATAENIADRYGITREDQDLFALSSQSKAAAARESGRFAAEIVAVSIPGRKGNQTLMEHDEHPRATSMEVLSGLRSITGPAGAVTAGNSSGVNDGAAAMIVASEDAVVRHGLIPRARIVASVVTGVEPRYMGIGPVPATQKLLGRTGLGIDELDVIELNEAFAAQALAVLRQLGIADGDPRINPNGGAIALGHPLGMSGARLAMTLTEQLRRHGGRYGLASMCVGVGQGISMLLERV